MSHLSMLSEYIEHMAYNHQRCGSLIIIIIIYGYVNAVHLMIIHIGIPQCSDNHNQTLYGSMTFKQNLNTWYLTCQAIYEIINAQKVFSPMANCKIILPPYAFALACMTVLNLNLYVPTTFE